MREILKRIYKIQDASSFCGEYTDEQAYELAELAGRLANEVETLLKERDMNQREMCYDAMSAPSRRYLAVCEIQDGPNPLSDDELDKFAERQPQFADAVKAWKSAKHHNV